MYYNNYYCSAWYTNFNKIYKYDQFIVTIITNKKMKTKITICSIIIIIINISK